MPVTGKQLVDKAHSYIGEHEEPMGSNTGPFVLKCQHASFLGGTRWPWCAAFEDKVCADVGVPLAYNGAGAHDQADHHKPWVSLANAHPGMMVDFNIGSGHTGILVSVNHTRGTVTTIDGNWGDKVALVEHPISQIRAIWKVPRVTYTTSPPPQPAPKRLPNFIVATSHNGHRKILYSTRSKRNLVAWLGAHVLSRIAPNGITITRAKAK